MTDNTEKFEKGRELFRKGTEAYHSRNFEEALKFFEESTKFIQEDSTDVYITSCKKKIKAQKTATGTAPAPEEETKANPEQDRDCQDVLKKKDYYEILGLSREATEDEIKRAYRKMAIKFHPDKNQSNHAADAFKKISHAFTTLKDAEKKQFYDKYGCEEELREKYHQQQQHFHEEDEMDPFDLFEMFFSGNAGQFYQRGGRVFRRRGNEEQAQEHRQQRQQQPRQAQPLMFMQMLPLLVLILYSVLPYLFTTKPYYQFFIDEDFYKKMTTSVNRVDYYVGDRFLQTYTTLDLIRNLEPTIEREFLANLSQQCAQVIRYKNELEYKLSYYRAHSTYRVMIENELKKLDYSSCEKYYKFRDRIR